MFKEIIHWAIVTIWEIIRPIILAGLLVIIIGFDFHSFEITKFSFEAFMWLLPAIFLYRFSYILKLKYYICDILYFIGFISAELYWIHSIFKCSVSSADAADITDCQGICLVYVYMLFFVGLVVYLAEIIFRNKIYLKELGYKHQFNNANWEEIFGQIFKNPKLIFSNVFKFYIIAVFSFFIPNILDIPLHFHDWIFIFYSLLFCLCLLPAMIIYHSACNLRLKLLICDMLYILVFICTELILVFLSFGLSKLIDKLVKNNVLPFIDIDMILGVGILGLFHSGVIVYIFEVYFRNREILKSYEKKIVNGNNKSIRN